MFSFSKKYVSKLKYRKRSKLPHVDLSNEGLFWKSLVPFCSRTYALSVALKWNLLEKAFSSVKIKTNPNFAAKLAERSNHSFLLSIWWITFFKHLYYHSHKKKYFLLSLVTMVIFIRDNGNLIHCVNIRKSSETAKQPFLYWIK